MFQTFILPIVCTRLLPVFVRYYKAQKRDAPKFVPGNIQIRNLPGFHPINLVKKNIRPVYKPVDHFKKNIFSSKFTKIQK